MRGRATPLDIAAPGPGLEPEERTVGRAAVAMGAVTAASRALGAVRVLVIAAVLGTSHLGNAFTGANSFSSVLFELLAAGALSAVLVPSFVARFEAGDRAGAERVAGGVLGLALAALGVVTVVGVVGAPVLATLLTAGVDRAVAGEVRALTAFLLVLFVPQVLLYAVGTVSTAVLHARRSFLVPAAAPIGNTVVLVAALALFASVTGDERGLGIGTGARLVLGFGGTLGVAAFVAAPTLALRATGFRLRPRWGWRDDDVRALLRLSGWAGLQHAGTGLLLLAAIVVGGVVEGGVVAHSVAWVVFLAPYGVLAQPLHTTVLPRLSAEAAEGDLAGFGEALRWAVGAMAVAVLPAAALLVALSVPLARALAFGRATASGGVELLAAGLAGLALGLFGYGAFLLLARAWYALGDSRTPAVAAVASAAFGALVMVVAGRVADGPALVFALGLGHSAAYSAGAVWLAVQLRRETGQPVVPRTVAPAAALAGILGLAAWMVLEAWDPAGRALTVLALVATAGAGLVAYLAALRRLGLVPARLAA